MTPAAALQAKAIQMLDAAPSAGIAVATDAHSYPHTVLVAIARPTAAAVISIPRAEYDGMWLLESIGIKLPRKKEVPYAIRPI